MNCRYCNDTRKYKEPKGRKYFDRIIDTEMEKAYFVNYAMAEEKAYKEVRLTITDCPYCEKQLNA